MSNNEGMVETLLNKVIIGEKYKTALLQLKKILSHDHRNLPISELEREEMLRIIKGALK